MAVGSDPDPGLDILLSRPLVTSFEVCLSTRTHLKMSYKPSLKDSELRYRRLFEAAQDGILFWTPRPG